MGLHDDVRARLDRIRTLWFELKRTRPTSRRYKVLVEAIRSDSLAHLAILEAQTGIDQITTLQTDARPEDVQGTAIVRKRGRRDLAPGTMPAQPPPPPPQGRVRARLERIKELWLELEETRRTSSRYGVLVELIHEESTAFLGGSAGRHDSDG
jgi:hypothetical protein